MRCLGARGMRALRDLRGAGSGRRAARSTKPLQRPSTPSRASSCPASSTNRTSSMPTMSSRAHNHAVAPTTSDRPSASPSRASSGLPMRSSREPVLRPRSSPSTLCAIRTNRSSASAAFATASRRFAITRATVPSRRPDDRPGRDRGSSALPCTSCRCPADPESRAPSRPGAAARDRGRSGLRRRRRVAELGANVEADDPGGTSSSARAPHGRTPGRRRVLDHGVRASRRRAGRSGLSRTASAGSAHDRVRWPSPSSLRSTEPASGSMAMTVAADGVRPALSAFGVNARYAFPSRTLASCAGSNRRPAKA